jgi:hypothetical protein
MAEISLQLDGNPTHVHYDKLVMAGYTGRDRGEVQAHIDELRTHGIPAPSRVPTLFACAPALLTTAAEIVVLGEHTSGEGEAVLFVTDREMLIGVGSDHTDRALEVTDIPRSKQVCVKPVSSAVWRFADVADHWDELVLRSWVRDGGDPVRYQEGTLARLMTPDDVLAYVRGHVQDPGEPMIVFAGTLPLLTDGFRPATTFAIELTDPRRNRSLRCEYGVRVLDYLL